MLLSQNAHMMRATECLSENMKAAGCRCGLAVSPVHSRGRGEETKHMKDVLSVIQTRLIQSGTLLHRAALMQSCGGVSSAESLAPGLYRVLYRFRSLSESV